jgi:hypothetical protein
MLLKVPLCHTVQTGSARHHNINTPNHITHYTNTPHHSTPQTTHYTTDNTPHQNKPHTTHHTIPHQTTPHHTKPHCSKPHHTTDNTPHQTTQQQTTPHQTTPHYRQHTTHNTQHHTQHTTPHQITHNTPHHTTPHHTTHHTEPHVYLKTGVKMALYFLVRTFSCSRVRIHSVGNLIQGKVSSIPDRISISQNFSNGCSHSQDHNHLTWTAGKRLYCLRVITIDTTTEQNFAYLYPCCTRRHWNTACNSSCNWSLLHCCQNITFFRSLVTFCFVLRKWPICRRSQCSLSKVLRSGILKSGFRCRYPIIASLQFPSQNPCTKFTLACP